MNFVGNPIDFAKFNVEYCCCGILLKLWSLLNLIYQ